MKKKRKPRIKKVWGLMVNEANYKDPTKLDWDPDPGQSPTRHKGLLKVTTSKRLYKRVWILRPLIPGGKHIVFTVDSSEKSVLAHMMRACRKKTKVEVSIKNGRLMGLKYNDLGLKL